jgi:outer membrane protein assembly factor BamB
MYRLAVTIVLAAALSLTAGADPRPTTSSRIAWRYEMLSNYISHRAAVGADGTVYVNDSRGLLHALTPSGELEWIYKGGSNGSAGPTVVGADGTIYFGTSGPNSAIHAVNPDGSRKWIFQAPDSQGPIGGPGVGPDGNVYAIFDLPGSIGAVSLTPAGALRWNVLGDPRVAEYGQTGKELVFNSGPSSTERQVYFTSTYFGDLWAFALSNGAQRFHVSLSRPGQAATSPRNRLYVATGIEPRLRAYDSKGQLLWTFFGDEPGVTNVLSAPDVGRDGRIYIDRNLSQLYSLEPSPAVRWISPSLLPGGPVPGPIVDPTDAVVVLGGQRTYGDPGLIQGFAAADGQLQFEIEIPLEPDGTCPVPYARPTFTPDGRRAYIPAAQLCQVPQEYHSWLYAVDIAP